MSSQYRLHICKSLPRRCWIISLFFALNSPFRKCSDSNQCRSQHKLQISLRWSEMCVFIILSFRRFWGHWINGQGHRCQLCQYRYRSITPIDFGSLGQRSRSPGLNLPKPFSINNWTYFDIDLPFSNVVHTSIMGSR